MDEKRKETNAKIYKNCKKIIARDDYVYNIHIMRFIEKYEKLHEELNQDIKS